MLKVELIGLQGLLASFLAVTALFTFLILKKICLLVQSPLSAPWTAPRGLEKKPEDIQFVLKQGIYLIDHKLRCETIYLSLILHL